MDHVGRRYLFIFLNVTLVLCLYKRMSLLPDIFRADTSSYTHKHTQQMWQNINHYSKPRLEYIVYRCIFFIQFFCVFENPGNKKLKNKPFPQVNVKENKNTRQYSRL